LAWLRDDAAKPKAEAELSLRNWVDFSMSLEGSWIAAPSKLKNTDGLSSDHVFNSVLWAQAQVTLFETERNWRYYSFGLYGKVPGIASFRTLCCYSGTGYPLGGKAGIGDPEAGVTLNLRGNFQAQVGYNGRSGTISLVDSYRNQGQPRPVNISDGMESIDASAQVVKYAGQQSRFVFVSGTGSRARPRRYSNGDRAERGDYHQESLGIGFVLNSRSAALLLWGGHGVYGSTRLFQASRTAGQGGAVNVVNPEREEYLAGLTWTPLSRGPASVGWGLTTGGIGTGRAYFAATVRFNFKLF